MCSSSDRVQKTASYFHRRLVLSRLGDDCHEPQPVDVTAQERPVARRSERCPSGNGAPILPGIRLESQGVAVKLSNDRRPNEGFLKRRVSAVTSNCETRKQQR